ncbi:hypothetical protein LRS74_25050 [Streptomyces sp. LX-29]|uniref:lipase/acyltransferase domain-containing protein n=1 Tax=Streptomyces sp. LX-29 TaxID=2900152 RepID=UPI00240E3460|nr:hypothetical protein [Streptomyces sp. LX-29]WFB09942.1 hypothetical protein LRS74_25050 [Streptomyces sp. LX-29]
MPFAYDWRLSCRHNAELLARRVDEELGRWRASAPERRAAEVVFVCHSMGGLIARYYVTCLRGHETTRRLITLGTPHRGSLDALLSLVNGVRPGWSRLLPDLTAFARSLPSLHQLTPDYACLASPRGLRHPRETAGLPGVDPRLLVDAGRFHAEMRHASATPAGIGWELLPVVGVRQPTPTTAATTGERLTPLDTIDGADEGGDGRVPRLSAAPSTAAHTPCEQHGSLQNNRGVRDALWGWLAPEPRYHRGPEADAVHLAVRAPELVAPGEPYEIEATVPDTLPGFDALALRATLTPAAATNGDGPRRPLRHLGGGRYATSFRGLAEGPYRAVVDTLGGHRDAVTALLLVAGPASGARDGGPRAAGR